MKVRQHERASLIALMNVLTFVQSLLRLKWTAGGGRAGGLSEWAIPDDDILDEWQRDVPVSPLFQNENRQDCE
jgi:hypothetical protein